MDRAWIPENQSTTMQCTMWKCAMALLVEENIIVVLSVHPKLALAIFLLQKKASNSSLLKLHHCKCHYYRKKNLHLYNQGNTMFSSFLQSLKL